MPRITCCHLNVPGILEVITLSTQRKMLHALIIPEQLYKDDKHSNINDASYSQPISTAVQVALIDLLRSFGIHPRVAIGHFSGEIAAA